jgi:hypothetical protein
VIHECSGRGEIMKLFVMDDAMMKFSRGKKEIKNGWKQWKLIYGGRILAAFELLVGNCKLLRLIFDVCVGELRDYGPDEKVN